MEKNQEIYLTSYFLHFFIPFLSNQTEVYSDICSALWKFGVEIKARVHKPWSLHRNNEEQQQQQQQPHRKPRFQIQPNPQKRSGVSFFFRFFEYPFGVKAWIFEITWYCRETVSGSCWFLMFLGGYQWEKVWFVGSLCLTAGTTREK